MEKESPSLFRRLLPLAIVLLLLAGVLLLLKLLEGSPEGIGPEGGEDRQSSSPPPTGTPAWLPEEKATRLASCRQRLEKSLGKDTEALRELKAVLISEPGRLVELLTLVRPEIDLAIRSGDPRSGPAALDLLATALHQGGERTAILLTSSGYRRVYMRALDAETPALRVAGLRFLASIDDEGIRSRAVRLLSDLVPAVRAAAVRTYSATAGPPGAARLRALFEGEGDAAVRTEILRAFGENRSFRGPHSLAVERRGLETGTPAEQLQVLENIALHRSGDAADLVIGALEHDARSVRKRALETLLVLRDRRALPALQRRLQDEPDDRLKALVLKVLEATR